MQSLINAELDKDDFAETDVKTVVNKYQKLARVFDAMKDFVQAAIGGPAPRNYARGRQTAAMLLGTKKRWAVCQ